MEHSVYNMSDRCNSYESNRTYYFDYLITVYYLLYLNADKVIFNASTINSNVYVYIIYHLIAYSIRIYLQIVSIYILQ
jgi:hypothetical protein